MQSISRLANAATRFNRIVSPAKRVVNYGTSTGRTADPAEHAVDPDEVYPGDAIRDEKRRHKSDNDEPTTNNESYIPPKSPIQSSPKIESPGVGPQTNPIAQQKRRRSAIPLTLDGPICAAIDGSPLPGQEARETDRRTQREEEEKYDREYFKDRKASPLSEIEIAETRKPVTVATDGTAEKETEVVEGGVWRAEQLETAEETMLKAAEMFRWNAVRGDPDSPHGRVLRQLRGEYW